MLQKIIIFISLFSLVFTLGCSSLAPSKDSSRFFTLEIVPTEVSETAEAAANNEQASSKKELIALMLPSLPSYLQRPQLVERKKNGELIIHEDKRWAELLDEAILRVLGHSLEAQFESINTPILLYPNTHHANQFIYVHILAFDAHQSGLMTLHVSWKYLNDKAENVLIKQGEMKLQANWDTSDYMSLTKSMSKLLAELAAGIRQAIAE